MPPDYPLKLTLPLFPSQISRLRFFFEVVENFPGVVEAAHVINLNLLVTLTRTECYWHRFAYVLF